MVGYGHLDSDVDIVGHSSRFEYVYFERGSGSATLSFPHQFRDLLELSQRVRHKEGLGGRFHCSRFGEKTKKRLLPLSCEACSPSMELLLSLSEQCLWWVLACFTRVLVH